MKKTVHPAQRVGNVYIVQKTLLIMRLTVFLSLLTVLQVMGLETYSQKTKISLNFENTPLKEVFRSIEKETDFRFMYSSAMIDVDRKINVHLEKELISEVLDEILRDTEIRYNINGRQILLSFRDEQLNLELSDQQPISVKGKVTDSSNQPLPGVTVVVKGTTQGTVTNADGEFSFTIPKDAEALQFSFVGMQTQEIPIEGRNTFAVVMREEMIGIEEVVAIGYGTQKKVNLTGAVSAVTASELNRRPVTNVQNLLQGKITGLQVVQNSGQPGDDGAVMRVRGLGTFSSAGSSPLVIIDGISGDMTNLNPDDVESISVLKDASSSAIYGARAANGVILITTKKGKSGTLSVNYHGNVQLHNPTRMPNLVTNSADYMEYSNQANIRRGMAPYFSQDLINAYRNNIGDEVNYPNFDWIDFMINNAYAQNHYLSANGGNDKTIFNVGLGYFDQNGIVGGHDYKKYDIRFNLESNLNERITFGTEIRLNYKYTEEPVFTDDNYMLMIYSAGPHYTPFLSDGSGRYTRQYSSEVYHNRNPLQVLELGSKQDQKYYAVAQSYFDVKITKDLNWLVKGAVDFYNIFQKDHSYPMDSYYFNNNEYSMDISGDWIGVKDNMTQQMLTTLFSTLNYNKTIAKFHNISALVGYNQESQFYRYLYGFRDGFPTANIKELSAGSSTGQSTTGTMTEWAIQSLFSRIGYNYKEKYLFETNFRYDGTSRIHKDKRWGVFPSFSFGWRMSEEDFLNKYEWIDNLKLRGSWGILGNQNIGTYPYQDILSLTSYPFSSLEEGVYVSRLTDKSLEWEKTEILDFGFDLNIKNNLFSLSADWYNKVTSGILAGMPIPASIGLSAPTVNYAEMKNTGVEFELGHMKSIRDFKYQVGLNFSTFKNEVTKVLAPSYGTKIVEVGLPYNSHYLVEWVGIFQSQEEIDNGPKHPYDPKPGDLKFKDQNDDDVINHEDRVVLDGAYPKFYYGSNINLSWKNIELSAFFQGVSGQKFNVMGWGLDPFMQETAPTKEFISKMWTPDNKTNDMPALYRYGYGPVTGTQSSYFLRDASYLRLKNLNIEYTVPSRFSQKVRMKNLRLYVSGDNIFTLTKYPGADPERTGDGRFATYPQIRIYTCGIKASF